MKKECIANFSGKTSTGYDIPYRYKTYYHTFIEKKSGNSHKPECSEKAMIQEVKNMEEIKKYSIVDLENPVDKHGQKTSIIQGHHYGCVIQNDKGNKHSNTIIVAFITSNTSRLDLSCNCLLQWYDFLYKPSVVLTSQIMTVDRSDIIAVLGELRPEDQIRVDKALKASLGLED